MKGWNTAKRALELLPRLEPKASVVTYGPHQCANLAALPHIHLNSPTDRHLRELYSQSGVFLSASNREGFCLPALEAMACGLPVVITNSGGPGEFAIHSETALVVPVGDSEALAGHLASVTADEALAARLAQKGREMAATYPWSRVIDRLEDLFCS